MLCTCWEKRRSCQSKDLMERKSTSNNNSSIIQHNEAVYHSKACVNLLCRLSLIFNVRLVPLEDISVQFCREGELFFYQSFIKCEIVSPGSNRGLRKVLFGFSVKKHFLNTQKYTNSHEGVHNLHRDEQNVHIFLIYQYLPGINGEKLIQLPNVKSKIVSAVIGN